MSSTIFGVFSSQNDAEELVNDLAKQGFSAEKISVIAKEGIIKDNNPSMLENVANRTAGGLTAGGLVGGLTGLLVGIGALAVPGLGAILIGGPLAAALGVTGATATAVSAAATGAFAGGLLGAFGAIGLPKETVQVYEEKLREGAVIIAVVVESTETENVKTMFSDKHAEQVHEVFAK